MVHNDIVGVNVILFTECHWYSNYTRNAGTYRIATELRKNGFTVQVIDFFGFMTKQDFEKIANKFVGNSTLIIGFSSTFLSRTSDEIFNESLTADVMIYKRNNLKPENIDKQIKIDYSFSDDIMQEIIAIFKDRCSKLKVVYGGAKAKNLTARFVDCFIIDFAEENLLMYLNQLALDRLSGTSIADNITLLKFSKDDDTFNFKDSEIVWDKSDLVFSDEVLPIELSRGCIFKCKFCNYIMIGRKGNDHVKSIDVLKEELVRNYEMFGTTKYIFCDDTFNDSTEKLEQIARMIQNLPFELSAAAYIRPELIHRFPAQLQLLRDIGLRFAKFGIESLNNETRKFIGKGVAFERMIDILGEIKNAWGDNVITSGSFIFGLPKETKDSLAFQSNWLEHDCLDVLHGVSLFPLFINFNRDSSIQVSDIDTNFVEYGYIQTPGKSEFNWRHPEIGVSFDEMRELTKKLTAIIFNDKRCRAGGFSGMMLNNAGINFATIAKTQQSTLNYGLAQQNYARRIEDYKRELFKI